jgi:pyridoxamine 5'-phosphate oxidase
MEPDFADLRREYADQGLSEQDVAADPVEQFHRWLADAVAAGLPEPNAMVLATADADGQPSARTVLLKGVDARGFVWFTNYRSRKGRDLAANPRAALLFAWVGIERQVGVTGRVERVDPEESAAYFAQRPYGAQLGAWASEQSEVIPSRGWLEERVAAVAARYPEGRAVPMPPHWGGLRLVPESVEFWQGRTSRLHDRLRYRRDPGAASGWTLARLSP